ncbi:MAG: condensation domain-containing protein [Mycetocola reblochoni]
MTTPLLWPTTPLQRGLLASPTAYLGRTVIAVDGPLRPERFTRAVTALHEAYPQLNAGFLVTADVEPTQFVTAVAPRVSTTVLDGDVDDAELDRRAEGIAEAWALDPVELSDPPALRWHLLTTGARGRIVLVAHHAVLDAWSVPLIVAELGRLSSDVPGPAPASCDYAAHLQLLQGADRAAAAEHWRDALGHLTRLSVPRWLELPGADGAGTATAPQPPTARTTAEEVLDPRLTARITARAEESGLTVADVLRGAVALAVDWLSGAQGTPLVTPVHGRDPRLPGVENTPGLFTDSVIAGHPCRPGALGDALAEHAAAWAAGLDHHHVGLSGILGALGIADPSRVLYAHEVDAGPVSSPVAYDDGETATLRLLRVEDTTHYPVEATTVLRTAGGDGPTVAVRVDADERLAPRSARRLVHAITVLLRALADAPTTPLSALDLRLPEDAVLARTSAAADGPGDAATAPLLPEALATALAAAPSATALVTDEGSYTAAELSAAIAETAGRLLAATSSAGNADAGRGERRPLVALQLPRTAAAVITLLAAVSAGLRCLVLDPAMPPRLLDETLDELDAALLIDTDGLHRRGDHGATAPEGAPPAPHPVRGGDTAFIVLTSGSTGRPKPVAVPHRAMAALLDHHRTRLWNDRVRVLAHTNALHFDAHWDALLGLFDGRTVRLVDTAVLLDPRALALLLERERIDYLDIGPAVWSSHLAAGTIRRLPAVCVAGGEAFPPELWRRMGSLAAAQRRYGGPAARVLNLYGPTENAVDALLADVADSDEPRVGRPVGATTARVLDDWLRPVAPGTEGELYLGGDQLAHGYQGRAALTAERFVAGDGGERLYRTGDRAWLDEDGSLALLGRSDEQIALNGFRIEPGEVAAALSALPGVAQAHVAALAHPRGGARLVGWVVPAPTAEGEAVAAAPAALREALTARLSPHLVPTSVLAVDGFSVTSNGKLDVRALPRPVWAEERATPQTTDQRRPWPDGTGTAPAATSGATAALLRATEHVLGTADAGSSLLALGGDSISAIRVCAALRREGWTLAPSALLDGSPLAVAAGRADARNGGSDADAVTGTDTDTRSSGDAAVPGRRAGDPPRTAHPWSAGAPGSALPAEIAAGLPDGAGVEEVQPLGGSATGIYVTGMRAGGDDPYRTATLLRVDGLGPDTDAAALATAWDAVVLAHPALRVVAVQGAADLPSAVVIDRSTTVHHVVEASEQDAEAARTRALALALSEQDLAAGRLSVAVWLRLTGPDGSVRVELALGLHHLLADGWTTPLLAAELARALGGLPLAPERVWLDYLAWLDAQDDDAWRRLWRERFPSDGPVTLLAPSRDAGAAPGTAERRIARWTPGAAATAALGSACRSAGVTTATAVQAAWALTLAERTGRGRIVFGLTAAGRGVPLDGVEDAVGAFLTTRPMAVDTTPPAPELFAAIVAETAATEEAAHLGPAAIAAETGTRYDSLVVVEAEPRAARGRPDPGETAAVSVVPVRGEDASGFPVTLTLGHGPTGTNYEVELDHAGADDDTAAELVSAFARRLASLLGVTLPPITVTTPRQLGTPPGPGDAAPAAPAALPEAAEEGSAPLDEVRRVMAAVLGVGEVGAHDDFFDLGGDSILVMALVGALRRAGHDAAVAAVFRGRTAAGIAAASTPVALPPAGSPPAHGGNAEPLPLTPALRWYRDHVGDSDDPFVQLRVVALPTGIPNSRLARALDELVARHEALRLRLIDGGETVRIAEPAAAGGRGLLVDGTGADDPLATARAAAGRLDPRRGRLLAGVRLDGDRLLLIAHHLGVDAVSWPILLAELRELSEGRPLRAAPSFTAAAHALALAGEARRPQAEGIAAVLAGADAAQWEEHAAHSGDAPIPGAAAQEPAAGAGADAPALSTVAQARRLTVAIGAEATGALLARTDRALPLDVLLAAAAARAAGRPLTVEFEGHGRPLDATGDARDDVDLAGTVGWFTSTWALTLPGPAGADQGSHLAACAAAAAAVRRLADPIALCDVRPPRTPELLVNYLGSEGRADPGPSSAWDVVDDAAELEDALGLGGSLRASHAWELNAGLSGGELVLHWQCADDTVSDAEVEEHIAATVTALHALAGRTPDRARPPAVAGADSGADANTVVDAARTAAGTPLDLVGLSGRRLAALAAEGVDGV